MVQPPETAHEPRLPQAPAARRVLMVTPYFPPEVGAPQSRLYELAVRLVRRGHQVTVLTGFPNYPTGVIPPQYRGKRRMDEDMDGIRVVRTWIYATPNRGFLKRILNHLSFMLSATWTGLGLGKADALFVESPPLFDGLAGWVLSVAKGAPMVFNVADLWPQSAVELGMVKNPLLIKVAEGIEEFIYARSARIAAVTRGIERILGDRGFQKTVFLPNGVDLDLFKPGTSGEAFRARHDLMGRFLVVYAGTHGLSQGLEVLVEAGRLLEARGLPVTFLLVGDGSEKPRLMELARGVSTVRFLDSLPKREIPEVVAAADVYAVTLRDLPLFRGAVPSKLYEAMSAAKPVVLAAYGEAPDLLAEADAGLSVPPEDAPAFAEAVERLMEDPELCRRLGANGRRLVEDRYDREKLVDRFEAMLKEITPHVVG